MYKWCGARIADIVTRKTTSATAEKWSGKDARSKWQTITSVRMERGRRTMFRKLINRIKKHRFCKANRWYCPDCIYHEHLFDGVVYRGGAVPLSDERESE